MKREDISDALNFLDEDMIAHTEMVRKKKRQLRRTWRKWGAAAACLCLVCIAGITAPHFLPKRPYYEPDNNLPQDTVVPIEETISAQPPEFVSVSSLLEHSPSGMEEQVMQTADVSVEQYTAMYIKVSSADGGILAESMGEGIAGTTEWHYVSGHTDLQYLIREEGQEYSLWKFQCFDSKSYPYSDVLKLVYRISSAENISEIQVYPATMDNTDSGKKIQQEIGTTKITDRNQIETFYQILTSLTCYGSDRWDLIDYGIAEAAADEKFTAGKAVRMGRYLTVVTDYGNEIDGLKYTTASNMFYEFSGIAYNRLTEEQAKSVSEILGMEDRGTNNGSSQETETDYQEASAGSSDAEEVLITEADNTNADLEYVTKLQSKVSNAMLNHELPFVITSSVYENPYRLHVTVTSNSESDLQKLKDMDTLGGVLEIEYVNENHFQQK